MKLFTCKQIAEIDRKTMAMEPISSIDLMERAAARITNWLLENTERFRHILLFAGPGNNGGDALAVARMLAYHDYRCTVFLSVFGKELKGDPLINWQRLEEQRKVTLRKVESENDFPLITSEDIVIDGLFGSGLNKPLEGLAASLVEFINNSLARVISIDVPSGLFGEDNSANVGRTIVEAAQTLTFQFPKLSFLFAENFRFTGDWAVLPIDIHPLAIDQTESLFYYLTSDFISGKIKKRDKFSHKGNFGYALLIAGSYGKMGAAVLASRACLRSGTGLLTSHIPEKGYEIMQISAPETMISIDSSETVFSLVPELGPYSAVGIGPGLDKKEETKAALKTLLQKKPEKMVIDADALNILSENKEWYSLLPENAILTPHPKEFERLAGTSANSFDRLKKQMDFSVANRAIVVLKGAHTSVSFPDGRVFFNSTGNPGMATAGSGDVLTGIILGLLAQSYSPEDAALIGVYLHGLAGDLAKEKVGECALIASDIIENLGCAFLQLV
ncbi:MAG TPA: NAD(P)H-hydrate dehydratase [Prolixibacteraceae bacterium]|nr:NAD(P)H-hydrate dehydratase [Prolixibacteraceae bacterium]